MSEDNLLDEFLVEEDPPDGFLCNVSNQFEKEKFVAEVNIFADKKEENEVFKGEKSVVGTTEEYLSDKEKDLYNRKFTSKPERVKSDTSLSWLSKPKNTPLLPMAEPKTCTEDVFTDPVFGLRIVNPLVSSQVLRERMIGRETVPFNRLKNFITSQGTNKDWVLAGVLVTKFPVQTSQEGKQYSLWKLSDLKNDIKTITLFLCGSAHSSFWKTTTGTVLVILNPNAMESKSDFKDEASLKVDNAQNVMILGQSKDLGACKGLKKNGEKCNAIINVNQCGFCVYHVKQEYRKYYKRSDLQAKFVGPRNKVLEKNEKLEKKDRGVLDNLNGMRQNSVCNTSAIKKRTADMLEVSYTHRLKDALDAPLLKTQPIPESSANVRLPGSSNMPKENVLPKRDPIDISWSASNMNNLNGSITPKHIMRTKHNAIKYNRKNGPITKADPNSIGGSVLKRKFEKPKPESPADSSNPMTNAKKKSKLETNKFISDRSKKMMSQTFKHLTEQRGAVEAEQKLEMKERMKEKITNTFEVSCKPVTCTVSKYTSFPAPEESKLEKHKLKEMAYATMDKFTDELLKKKIFDCKMCDELCTSNIFFVLGKGNVCGKCFEEKCGEEIRSRAELNTAHMSIMSELILPCKFQWKGCQKRVPSNMFSKHIRTCDFKIKPCPMKNLKCCNFNGCHFELSEHLFKHHHKHVIKGDNNIFKVKTSLLEPFNVKILSCDWQSYLLRTALADNKWFYAINPLYETNESMKYSVVHRSISIPNLSIKTEGTLTKSNGFYNEQNLKNNPNATAIDMDTLKHLTNEENMFLNDFNLNPKGLDENMLKLLECPVCMNIMRPPIFQCNHGHNICILCRQKVNNCPTCKGQLIDVRNLFMENFTVNVKYPCKFKDFGCKEIDIESKLRKHEEVCLYLPKILGI